MVRRPRAVVTVNGVATSACVDAQISTSRSLEAASFRLRLNAEQAERELGLSWFGLDTISIQVGILVTDDAKISTPISTIVVSGIVDAISFDAASSLLVIRGRDQAAALIDRPLVEAYLNRTSSEIIQTLGAEYGLAVEAQPTTTIVGQYYQLQRTKNSLTSFSRHGSVWDLMVELAGYEKYDLWVDNNTLYFMNTDQAGTGVRVTYDGSRNQYVSDTLDIMSLQIERNCRLDQAIQVTVTSWNSRQKTTISACYPDTTAGPNCSFAMVKPNLLLDEAQALAVSTYGRIARQGRVLSCAMVGETTLTARSVIQVSGLSSPWDGAYAVDRLERHFSCRSGYTQRVVARAVLNEGSDVNMA